MLLKKLLKFFIEAIVAILVLVAILLGIARSLLPYVDRYHSNFETWAGHAIAHPVSIGKVAASWRGLYPQFSFDHIIIYDSARKIQLLKIKHFQISLNLFASLINKQITPAEFHVSGTYLSIHQLENNDFAINGIRMHFAPQQLGSSNIQNFLEQMLEQGQVLLDEMDVDWYGKNGLVLPITNLQLKLSKHFFQHQVIGIATLIQKKPAILTTYHANNFLQINIAQTSTICALPPKNFHALSISKRIFDFCPLPPPVKKVESSSAQVRFVLNLHGDFLQKSQLKADGYIYIKNLQLEPWLKNHIQNGFSFTEGKLSQLQLWANWSNQQLQQVQSVFTLNNGLLRSQATGNMVNVNIVSGNIAWQRHQNGWDLAADQLQLNINNHLWPLTQLSIQNVQPAAQPELQLFRADTLELAPLNALLRNSDLISENISALLQAMQPVGEIKNLIIRRELPIKTNEKPSLSASADFKHVGLQPWKKFPGIENLSGHLLLTPTTGDVQLAGDNLSVMIGQLFHQPVRLTNYHGRVEWLQTDTGWKVQASDLALNNNAFSLRGDMDLYLPSAGDPIIRLLTGFSINNIVQAHQYIPTLILKPKLTAWLEQAFVGGENITGQMLLQGPLLHFPFEDHTGQFEIAAHATHLDFSFHTGWPLARDMDADMFLDGKRLQVKVASAKILGVPVNSIYGEIDDLITGKLEVQGNVVADMRDCMRFIFKSPLQVPLAGLKQLDMQGPMRLNLKLEVPLHEASNAHELPKVDGDITLLPGGMAKLPAWNISMDQLQGQIHFTERSVQSQGLQANWLGQPVAILVQSIELEPLHHMTTIQLTGNAMIKAIIDKYQVNSLRNIISGAMQYQAQLQLNKNKDQSQNRLIIDSDLQGVAINLPDPIKKSAASKMPAEVELDFSQQNKLNLFATLAKKLSLALSFDANKSGKYFLKSGNLRFGSTKAALNNSGGLTIDGELARLDWSEVSPFLTPYLNGSPATNTSFPLQINQIHLSIAELDALGMQVLGANILARPMADAWSLRIDSPAIAGRILLPKDLKNTEIQGRFQHFTFVPGESSISQSIEPAKVPPLNLLFQDFSYEQRHLGKLTLVTFPENNTLVIEKLALDTPNLNLSARGRWQGSANRQQTTLNGNIKSNNIGAALKSWQVTNSLESGEGTATFALSWPAAAYKYSSAILNGSFSFSFNKGRIVNISQGTEAEMGIGRILNLLSLQSLPRRLALDFSDLFSKGFTFDTMRGDFAITRGNMTTNNTYLNGPIAKVEAQGRIGLAAKDYNLVMTITPYVTSNIPVIATIAGGPIVGAAAWVANKIFGGIVNKMTSHAYSVQGSWAKPIIEKLTTLERRSQPQFSTVTSSPNTVGT